MYSAVDNQVVNLARYGFAFLLLFVLGPRVLFKERREDRLAGFLSGYVKMVCLIIAIGYILVFLKLYELLSLVTVLALVYIYNIYLRVGGIKSLKEAGSRIILSVYDFLDGRVQPGQRLTEWGRQKIQDLKGLIYTTFSSLGSAGSTFLLAAVMIYAAYLRFYDAVLHAAPAMSDAYVTLAWMKYIARRTLFHDGIYPQGFHIYLATLHKFAANDPLYVLKYTGPLNGVLTTLGLYFVISRFTGRATPGIISAFVYGVLVDPLHLEWARQVSTNSQEFALVFLLPAWYFAHRYLKSGEKADYWSAAACFLVIGWVHTIVFIFLGLGLVCLIFACLTINFRSSVRPAGHLCLAGGAAGVLAGLPAGLGLLIGRQFHGASVDFLTLRVKVPFPPVNYLDQVALGGIGLFFFSCLLSKKTRKDLVTAVFILLLGLSAFAIYAALGPITGNAILATRMSLLWGLVAPAGIGLGWSALTRFGPEQEGFKPGQAGLEPGQEGKKTVETLLCLVVVAFTAVYFQPAPAKPYKMQYDSMVEQYLRISSDFLPTEWMIVSAEEGYALALGKGYHLMLGDFLSGYDPMSRRLARVVDGREEVLSTPDTFIFKEKRLFQVTEKSIEPIMKPILQRRAEEYRKLDQWVEKYRAGHDNLSIYYEDSNIQVIRIHQPRTREKIFRDIWGS